MKTAAVDPAGTVTEIGTVTSGLVLDTATAAPPEGAGLDRVTVHDVPAPEPRVVRLQAKEETSTGATRPIVAGAELLLYVAVTVADMLLLKVAVLALKLPVVAPDTTITEGGTVSAV